jgi:hypothetical protein
MLTWFHQLRGLERIVQRHLLGCPPFDDAPQGFTTAKMAN